MLDLSSTLHFVLLDDATHPGELHTFPERGNLEHVLELFLFIGVQGSQEFQVVHIVVDKLQVDVLEVIVPQQLVERTISILDVYCL